MAICSFHKIKTLLAVSFPTRHLGWANQANQSMNGEHAQQFFDRLDRPWFADQVFDWIPDSVFFVKDEEGRYVAVNQTLVERCGKSSKDELIGQTARSLFPEPLGDRFTEQDLEILKNGPPIRGQLELHLYPNGSQGWCTTWKEPVTNSAGEISGVAGVSRDLPSQAELSGGLESVSKALHHIDNHLDDNLAVKKMAELANLSAYKLDLRIRTIFGVTIGQYITRRRIEYACHLLERTNESLSIIALECGYSDQSAFTRQFRQSVGIPPGTYRDSKKSKD
ncbi:helix-turn-helix domain-containing protein [Haloferula sp.]|uniref:AraC family transcriptional regulator n=1 Tax=Haloferula sp. TaxID=2497595 RepID=UPI00329F17A9